MKVVIKIIRYAARRLAWIVYNNFAKYLPVSYSPRSLGLTKPFRGMLCRYIFRKCGKNIKVERAASINVDIKIGDNSGIGKNFMMGPDVVILTRNHKFNDVTSPIITQVYYEKSPVFIEDDVWIGTRIIILPGVRSGRSSMIGAGAVATKDIPPFSIAAGNPARVIRNRKGNGYA